MNARTLKKLERRRRVWMSVGFLAFLALLCYDVIEIKSVRRPEPFRTTAHAAVKAASVTATEASAGASSSKDDSTDVPFVAFAPATPVPEPSSVLLLAPALLLLTSRRKP